MHFEFHKYRRKTEVSCNLMLKKEGRKRERRGKKGRKTYMRKRHGRQRMTRGKVTKRNKAWERIGETRARGEYHNRWGEGQWRHVMNVITAFNFLGKWKIPFLLKVVLSVQATICGKEMKVKIKFQEDTCTDLFESVYCQETSAPEPLRAMSLQQLQNTLAFSYINSG